MTVEIASVVGHNAWVQWDRRHRERATLADGRDVVLRLVRPDDKALLSEGLERLSETGRYRRFFTSKPRLSASELRYLTEVDQDSHVAIGAVRQDGEQSVGLGVARFVRDKDDPTTAEAAIAITDDAQGLGLGSLLLSRLVDAALERGVTRFHFEVLENNAPMMALLGTISDDPRVTHEGPVVCVDLPLTSEPVRDDEPAPEKPLHDQVLELVSWLAPPVGRLIAWLRQSAASREE